MTTRMRGSHVWVARATVLATLALAHVVEAAPSDGTKRASYRDLLNEYPVVVLASWDDSHYKQTLTAGAGQPVHRLHLRVHHILKGESPSVVKVSLAGGLSVRYGAEGDDRLASWQADQLQTGRNTWALCTLNKPSKFGPAVHVALIRDVRQPAVYFLGRREGRAKHFDHRYIIRGAKWQPLPMALPGPYRPMGAPPKDAAKKSVGLVISRLGEVQNRCMMDGWGALLAGEEPDLFFRAVQQFDPHTRGVALNELRARGDRKLWGRFLDVAIEQGAWAAAAAADDELLGLAVLERLRKGGRLDREGMWRLALGLSRATALAAAKGTLVAEETPSAYKAAICRSLAATADPADGAAEAELIAECLSAADDTVSRAAAKALVTMLVRRGGSFPQADGGERIFTRPWCRQGALAKVTGAIRTAVGAESMENMLSRYPALAEALSPRMTRTRPARPGYYDEQLALFKDGEFPRGPRAAPWEALMRCKMGASALDIMTRALMDQSLKDYHRRRCLAGMMEAAILAPGRVRAALAKLGPSDQPDILAVRRFLDPAGDVQALVEQLISGRGPAGAARTLWGLRTIGGAVGGKERLVEVIRKRSSKILRRQAMGVMVDLFGRPATAEAVRDVPKLQADVLELCRPTSRPTGSVWLESLESLEAAIKFASDGKAAHLTDKQFGECNDAMRVLRSATTVQAPPVVYEFLLQRPYVLDLQTGAHTPAGLCRIGLDILAKRNTQLYFKALDALAADLDTQWRGLAYDHLGALLGGRRANMAKIVTSFAQRPHMGEQELRRALLGALGHPIGKGRGDSTTVLSEAVYGRPILPLCDYSRGGDDEAAAHLASWLIERRWGARGAWAVAACKSLPEGDRPGALAAALKRLLREGPRPRAQ